ncbi:MAG: polysaccharide deacetylase family protein [Halorhodospira sp.]
MISRIHLAWAAALTALITSGGAAAIEPIGQDTGAEGSAVAFVYHRFGEDEYPSTSIQLAQFEAQLDYLEEHEYTVWPLEWIVDVLRHGGELPERTVALTVDDAYASVYEEAFPRLQERGWPLTVFVATEPVDAGHPNYMDWEQMREMRDSGLVRFANHSASHDYMARRDPDEDREAWQERVRADLAEAEQRLQEELGEGVSNDPKLFAYPYGEYDPHLAEIVREAGYVGLGQHSGAIGPLSDVRALPRFPVNEQFGALEDFTLRAQSLPLPVVEMTPFDPLIAENNPPRMELHLASAEEVATDRLNCFASGQGGMEIEWLDAERTQFAVEADAPFGEGRARYNCTAPADDGSGRFFWYSKQWLNH